MAKKKIPPKEEDKGKFPFKKGGKKAPPKKGGKC